MTQICFSAHEAYLPAAIEELRAVFPQAIFSSPGPDLGAIAGDGVSIVSVHGAVTDPTRPVAFVQHLFREVGTFPLPTSFDALGALLDEALETWQQTMLPETVSLHVWASVAEGAEAPTLPVRMDELWRLLADGLADEGFTVKRAGTAHILSACVTPDAIILGSNRAENALSDWPGGRIRLAKPKGQISRSEFKLEELMRGYGIRFPQRGCRALDLGAAPGGWTRILHEQGLQVTAVDPGALDPRIARAQGVTHVRKTTAAFLKESSQRFDLVVNDMRMAPSLSVDLILSCWAHLNPSGMMVMTLKLSPHHAAETVRQSVMRLRQRYDIELVRQLQHNRNEVTVVGRRRG